MNDQPTPTADPAKSIQDHLTLYFLTANYPQLAERWMVTGGDTTEAQIIVANARQNALVALAAINNYPGPCPCLVRIGMA